MPRPGLVGHVMPTSQASIDFGAKYELMNMAVVQKEQSNFITELIDEIYVETVLHHYTKAVSKQCCRDV